VSAGPRWGPAASLAALVACALAAWLPLLGAAAAPALAPAAVAVLVAAGLLRRRIAVAALAAWVPAALVLAGAPPARAPAGLWQGVQALALADPVPRDPWPVAAALLASGGAWLGASLLASRVHLQGGAAFALATLPWVAALARDPAAPAAWQGALVLGAGLLSWTSGRLAATRAIALSLVVALVAAGAAQALAPRRPWLDIGYADRDQPFTTLATQPTFGPLRDRRTGRTMVEIHADRPALWRMQALDVFDGFGWRADLRPQPDLPQPAAVVVQADVRVEALHDDLALAPGRIEQFSGRATRSPVPGEAWRLSPVPSAGERYSLIAEVVRADARELRAAPPPRDPRLRPFMAAAVDRARYGRVAALAHRLARGAATEWDVVARVVGYLRDSGRFRYTTDVAEPGPAPLADFLLRTHAGYCQHFAGAAALLLRLAGVPARMAVGFAPGVRDGRGDFDVRDVDAHAWVEVYFEGYGWVPFDPTPLAARATAGGASGRMLAALIAAVALVGVPAVRRRRRGRTPIGELLAAVVRRAGGHVEPSTTLGELRAELAARIGPRTAALAAATEHARFAPGAAQAPRRPRARIARALVSDLGTARAAVLLALPGARGRSRRPA
jgi:transglutaminase-like putative cysteine protease